MSPSFGVVASRCAAGRPPASAPTPPRRPGLRWLHERGHPSGSITAAQVREWSETTVPDSWCSRKQARTAVQYWLSWMSLPTEPVKAIRVPRKPLMKSRALDVADTTRLRGAAVLVGGRQGLVVLCGRDQHVAVAGLPGRLV